MSGVPQTGLRLIFLLSIVINGAKKFKKNEDFFWNEKRLRSGIFPLQRQTKQGGLPKLVKGTHC